VPKLRLSGGRSAPIARTAAADRGGAGFPVAGARTPRFSFAGDLAARTVASQRAGPWAGYGRGLGRPGGRPARTPGRNWLRAGGLGNRASRAAGLRGSVSRTAGSAAPGASVLAARSAPSGVSALSGAVTPMARRSPQAGWLRGSRPAARSAAGPAGRILAPRRGWLAGRRPRTVLGSGARGSSVAFRRGSIPRGNWYTAGPSRAWLRRSRHPWRKRRQQLLRVVGVGR
jgi:hypothetical protein